MPGKHRRKPPKPKRIITGLGYNSMKTKQGKGRTSRKGTKKGK